MGRKKNYSRDTLLEKAMELFRDYGYAGTSTQFLVEKLEINRFSLYAEFVSKQKLFDAALELYDNKVIEKNFGPLENSTEGIEEICTLLKFFSMASKGPASGRGCLLCNTAVEFGQDDPSGAGFVQRYFKRLSEAFCIALDNANSRGLLRDDVALKEESDYFTASILGMFVMIRAKAPSTMIENSSKKAIEHLEMLCV